jgi:quercetin dioxygenase-like cupin family protein
MSDDSRSDVIEFDPLVALALAGMAAGGDAPRPEVKRRLMDVLAAPPVPEGFPLPVPEGFSFRFAADADWMPHPVPGIRMKVLALNHAAGYATLLLDVAPGTRFPAHHHRAAEECYVLSGSLYTCDRRLVAGDFVHADADTDHGELWTEEGCRVLLVVPPEDHLPELSR